MIAITEQKIVEFYGPSGVSLKHRFNTNHTTTHTGGEFMYEFGYYSGLCIYAIIQKSQGNAIAMPEAAGMMTRNGASTWSLMTALDPAKDGAAIQKQFNDFNQDLGYSYNSVAQDGFFPAKLFASHQWHRRQVVIWHQICQINLASIIADPLV